MTPAHRPICVLSVGRSGTSLATRAVNLLGVDLGREDTMMWASDWNPRGFWEQQPVMDLNEEILAAAGGTYADPPELAPGWADAPAFGPLRERARALVRELYDGAPRWGFKDPRNVYTVDLWRAVVGEMDYLICVRDPLEVAASLDAGGVPSRSPGHHVELWLRANALALRQSEGRRRAFVHYEDWFRDPRAVARKLAALVHGTAAALSEAAWQRIAEEFDPSLRHQRGAGTPLAERGDVPEEVVTMDGVLRTLCAAPGPEAGGGPPVEATGRAAALGAGLFEAYRARRGRC